MSTFVIGDIHGAYKAFLQCLERSGFNKEEDTLISLGDVSDGWSQTSEVVDELLSIPNRICIMGNHDNWVREWFEFNTEKGVWLLQGGQATKDSYINSGKITDQLHKDFFTNLLYYYIDDNNRLFVHGGYNWHIPFEDNSYTTLMWDRHAFTTACYWEAFARLHPTEKKNYFKNFTEVFVGHTCTNHGVDFRIGNTLEPLHVANMWNLDQGAGWDGKLTIMDVNTKEYWQSDIVTTLYPEEKGRR